MPQSDIVRAAHALIAAHGAGAVAVAARSVANMRRLGTEERVIWWTRVVNAVKEIERAARR